MLKKCLNIKAIRLWRGLLHACTPSIFLYYFVISDSDKALICPSIYLCVGNDLTSKKPNSLKWNTLSENKLYVLLVKMKAIFAELEAGQVSNFTLNVHVHIKIDFEPGAGWELREKLPCYRHVNYKMLIHYYHGNDEIVTTGTNNKAAVQIGTCHVSVVCKCNTIVSVLLCSCLLNNTSSPSICGKPDARLQYILMPN